MLSKSTTTVLKQHIGNLEIVEGHIVSAMSAISNVEYRESELFVSAYQLYRGVKKAERATITKYLNQVVNELTKSTNNRTRFVKTFNQAKDYVESACAMKLKYLEYTNISKVVTLLRYMRKNEEDKFTDVVKALSSVYEDDMSPHRYNNEVADKIVALKEEYKLKEVEGEYKVLDFNDLYHTLDKSITELSKEQLLKLLGLVETQYDIIEANELEVA